MHSSTTIKRIMAEDVDHWEHVLSIHKVSSQGFLVPHAHKGRAEGAVHLSASNKREYLHSNDYWKKTTQENTMSNNEVSVSVFQMK